MEGLAETELEAEEAQAVPADEAPAVPADEVDVSTDEVDVPADEVEAGADEVEAGAATAVPPAIRVPPPSRVVRVVSVEVALPDQFPTVILEDDETFDDVEAPRERVAFRIGTAEGVALAHALAGTSAPRPLTHDLFARALERYGVEILAVRLTGRVGPTYLAELELFGPAGREVLSCRPSDGICLALRQRLPAPVLCDERLFAVSGDVLPDDPDGQLLGDSTR